MTYNPRILASFQRASLAVQNEAKVARIVKQAADRSPTIDPQSPAGKRALRGVPVVGAATGAIEGTDPAGITRDRRDAFLGRIDGSTNRETSHPDYEWNRLARQLSELNGGRWNFVERAKIITRDDSTCHICLRRLEPHEITMDHLVSSRHGGDHTAANIAVACRPCNASKWSRRGDSRSRYHRGDRRRYDSYDVDSPSPEAETPSRPEGPSLTDGNVSPS